MIIDVVADDLLLIKWDDDDKVGIDAYTLDGKLVYHLFTAGSSDLDRLTPLAVSPDQQVVAVAPVPTANPEDTPLTLMAADSSWTVQLSTDVRGNSGYHLAWSPDSKMLAFVEPVRQNGVSTTYSIHIVSATGKPLYQIDNLEREGELEWSSCE